MVAPIVWKCRALEIGLKLSQDSVSAGCQTLLSPVTFSASSFRGRLLFLVFFSIFNYCISKYILCICNLVWWVKEEGNTWWGLYLSCIVFLLGSIIVLVYSCLHHCPTTTWRFLLWTVTKVIFLDSCPASNPTALLVKGHEIQPLAEGYAQGSFASRYNGMA